MDQKQRIAIQRALCREAIGKLEAVSEYFGVEDGADHGADTGIDAFEAKLQEFKRWLWEESPIA